MPSQGAGRVRASYGVPAHCCRRPPPLPTGLLPCCFYCAIRLCAGVTAQQVRLRNPSMPPASTFQFCNAPCIDPRFTSLPQMAAHWRPAATSAAAAQPSLLSLPDDVLVKTLQQLPQDQRCVCPADLLLPFPLLP